LGVTTPTGLAEGTAGPGSVLALSCCVAAAAGRWRLRIGGRKWPVVTLICLMVLGTVLFLAQDPRTLHVESRLAVEDPAFPDYIASIVDTPVTRGDAYDVLQNGDQIYAAMLDAIAKAQRRIVFESYNYKAGEIGERFTVALMDAARRGVVVRLVLDSFGATPAPPRIRERMAEAGVRLAWFNPFGIWTVESTNNRTHRKVLVVDGEVGFTGGAGVADHWLGDAQGKDHWRDTQFKVNGPAVRLLEASFFENWVEAGGRDAPELDLGEPPGPGHSRSLVIWSNPIGGVSNVKLLFLYSIAGARRTIDIQSPYFIPDGSAQRAIADARRRGVEVRVLTDGDVTDVKSVKHASRNQYQPLLDAGVQIFEFQPTMMHTKVMVIDGQWSVFGSGNFDNRSLELNDEITVAVADADLGRRLVEAFEKDLTRSKQWRVEDWRRRPWHWKAREKFWGLFGEVF
jgi:cardiolipin synthase